MKFHELLVTRLIQETKDCISIVLEVPEALRSEYTFIPGQYINCKIVVDGEEVLRSYSISNYDQDGILQIAVKRVPNGVFSTMVHEELKEGMRMMVSTPLGEFNYIPNLVGPPYYILFAAGSGITPILSIIQAILKEDPHAHVQLFYGNRYSTEIIYKEALEDLKNQFMTRFEIFYILSQEQTESPIFSGRIDMKKVEVFADLMLPESDLINQVFICGPFDMIMNLKENLPQIGIAPPKIKFELFYNPQVEEQNGNQPLIESDTTYQIELTYDGITSLINTNFRAPILDLAAQQGLHLPYSCKGGVCSTCKAKVVEGNVEMQVNYALEEDEVRDGYVLACQAICMSPYVEINFDE